MQAFQLLEPGTQPELKKTSVPQPGPNEVRLRIRACGLNFADLLMVKGSYQDTPATPFTLGMEVAGEVDAIGDSVADIAIGQRVCVFAGSGGMAEYGCFPAKLCIRLPNEMSFEDAAAFQIAYGTSHMALAHRAALKSGETLLVTGAAGGVGLTAVELGKLMGASVIALVRGKDKAEVAKQKGADHVLDSSDSDLLSKLKELGGVDVVYETIGGDLFKTSLKAAKPEARILAIGFASGDVPQIPANHLLVKNVSVIGFYWGGYLKFRPEVLNDSLSQLFDWYKDGKIRPHICGSFPLSDAGDALKLLAERKSTGKVIVRP